MWRKSIPPATHQFRRSPDICCAFCPVLFLLMLWTVLLGRHRGLWLRDLLSDGSHEQPLNEVVDALSPNILLQFHSLIHRGTSLQNAFCMCLRFVNLQSNFRQLLTGYIAGVAENSSHWFDYSKKPVWNFLSRLLLVIPYMCLPGAAVYPVWAFSVPLPSVPDIGSYLCLCFWLFPIPRKCHQISISFSSTTWRIQSPPPAGLSWYLFKDLLGLPHHMLPPMPQTTAANCTTFSSLSSSRFRGGIICCLCLLANLHSQSPWATDGLCRSLLLDTCVSSSSMFSIFAQLRCSLPDSGVAIRRGPCIAALDVVWTWYWSELCHAPSRSLLAAHRLHSFLLRHTAQRRMAFCRLWRWSRPLRAARLTAWDKPW